MESAAAEALAPQAVSPLTPLSSEISCVVVNSHWGDLQKQKFQGLAKRIEELRRVVVTSQAPNESVQRMGVKINKGIIDLSMDTEDLLDDFKFMYCQLPRSRNGRDLVSFLYSNFFPLKSQVKISHGLKELNSRLDEIANRTRSYYAVTNPEEVPHVVESERRVRETCSNLSQSEVVGRESDKSQVIEKLFEGTDHGRALPVISIVAPKGVGKTTLVQSLYNDERMKHHFELRLWIYAGDGFVVKSLLGRILERILSGHAPHKLTSMNEMGMQVHGQFLRKKVLIVLDDVPVDDHNLKDKWVDLTLPLRSCDPIGSKIIVTTRSETVASNIRSTHTYNLSALSIDDCWDIFERRAFGEGAPEGTDELRNFGSQIVEKYCEGLPVLAKELGSLMRINRDEEYWLDVLDSGIRDIIQENNGDYGTALPSWSFEDLPSKWL